MMLKSKRLISVWEALLKRSYVRQRGNLFHSIEKRRWHFQFGEPGKKEVEFERF